MAVNTDIIGSQGFQSTMNIISLTELKIDMH